MAHTSRRSVMFSILLGFLTVATTYSQVDVKTDSGTIHTVTENGVKRNVMRVDSGASISLVCTLPDDDITGMEGQAIWAGPEQVLYFGETPAHRSSKFSLEKKRVGSSTQYILTMSDLSLDEEGEYKCQDLNENEFPLWIMVSSAPSTTSISPNSIIMVTTDSGTIHTVTENGYEKNVMRVDSGSIISLVCTLPDDDITGMEGIAIWAGPGRVPGTVLYFDETPAHRNPKFSLEKKRVGSSTQYILTMSDLSLDEEGEYKCQDLNENEFPLWIMVTFATASPVNSTRGDHIYIEKPMNNETLYAGEKANLRCRITGVPKPRYTWYKNDAAIPQSDDRRHKGFNIRKYDWGSKLTIKNVETTDTGYYTCKAESKAGTLFTTGILFAKLVPDLTTCQTRVQEAGQPLPGKYIPQCTEAGEFHMIQCHEGIGECWCVDENGTELEGTRRGVLCQNRKD